MPDKLNLSGGDAAEMIPAGTSHSQKVISSSLMLRLLQLRESSDILRITRLMWDTWDEEDGFISE